MVKRHRRVDPPKRIQDAEAVTIFLQQIRLNNNVSAAADAARRTRRWAYKLRARDVDFAQAWDDATEASHDRLESAAYERAVDGTDEPVYYRGKEVGVVKRYSDTLLLALLRANRREKYMERTEQRNTSADEAREREELARLAADPEAQRLIVELEARKDKLAKGGG